MNIAYLCSRCCKKLNVAGLHTTNEVGRKACYVCTDNDDDLSVINHKDLQSRLAEIEQKKKEKAEGIKTYQVVCDVETVSGWQQYKVKAKSEREALQLFRENKAEFDCEEFEVQSLGDPYIGGIDED